MRAFILALALLASGAAHAGYTATAVVCGIYKGNTMTCLTQTALKPSATLKSCNEIGGNLLQDGARAFRYVRIPGPYKSAIRCPQDKPKGKREVVVKSEETDLKPMPDQPSEWTFYALIFIAAALSGGIGYAAGRSWGRS